MYWRVVCIAALLLLTACNLSVPQVQTTLTLAPTFTPSQTAVTTLTQTPTGIAQESTLTPTPFVTLSPTASAPTLQPSATDFPTQTETPLPPSPTSFPTIGPTETPTSTLSATAPPLPVIVSFTPAPTFTAQPTSSPTVTLPPPTLDVTPTFITAEAVENTPEITPLPTETAEPAPAVTATLSMVGFPTLAPVSFETRAFAISAEGGMLVRGGVSLLPDVTLFERNPRNPAQYVMTDSSGLLYFTGINGENAARVDVSPFSAFIPFSREENNAYVQDVAWSPDGNYLAFLINGDKTSNDGVWYFQPGGLAPLQLLVDCPKPDHPGCMIVQSPHGPDLWESLSIEWSPSGDALLVRTYLPSSGRMAVTVLPVVYHEAVRDERPAALRYEYANWERNGNRLLVSGTGPDGRVLVAWVERDGSFSQLVFDADAAGLWMQDAMQQSNGNIVALGATLTEGGANAPQRLYNGNGQALTGPIGTAPPERVQWSPDRRTVLIVSNNRQYLATVDGAITDITDEVGGTQAVNWVDGSLLPEGAQLPETPLDDPQPMAPIGEREPETVPTLSMPTPITPQPGQALWQVYAEAGLFIRNAPSVSGDPVGSVGPGDGLIILQDAPVQTDSIRWWEIIAVATGETGWVAGEIDGISTIGP